MVRTGARAGALASLLDAAGVRIVAAAPAAPRLESLTAALRDDVMDLYRSLGGILDRPSIRPGAWDLALAGGTVLELDEELHFNRYRVLTLGHGWSAGLPWRDAYLEMCRVFEPECVRAGSWGKRWSNPSCEAMFGPAGPAGDLAAAGGAPRWKQRALYDAVKDAQAAGGTGPRVARVSVHDELGGTPLGAALKGRGGADPAVVRELVAQRTA